MGHSLYQRERMGRAEIVPAGAFEAGSSVSFTLTYTAGTYGIDDTGSIKIVHRFASDAGRPQFEDPAAPNYVTVEASNGAVLELRYDPKQNIRPWDKTLYIKVVRGFLREGDRIVVRFGDPWGGCPGMRLQTFCEERFQFRVLVDAFATYDYVELPEQPAISIVPGPPVLFRAVLPTLRRPGEPFALGVRGEDRWGNPSDRCDHLFTIRANLPVEGLPREVALSPGTFATRIEGLRVSRPGDLAIELVDRDGKVVAVSNPLRIAADGLPTFWADVHGQSEETIGTNPARAYFTFARDRAFLDVTGHQGNDFQITDAFWRELNRLTAEFDEDGRFVVFPGYEWSGNTALGGDRNVFFAREGRPIRRSSHALVPDLSDADTDVTTAEELFAALRQEDCFVIAHVGGRYADIRRAHDGRLERSVEVHSAWGTFEWLLHDAFELGYRVGVVCNSDGHKGRPGASHPGASMFGAYGGLTCLFARELTRPAIFEAYRRRHHYGTTGCRLHLDVRVRFDEPAELFDEDPALGPAASRPVREATMGDILRVAGEEVELRLDLLAGSPVERVEIRNGRELLETFRPYGERELGSRIRVIWEGAAYRGRGRQTVWDGHAVLEGNRFRHLAPINFWNLEKRFERTAPERVEWSSLTTGNFAGFDAWLEDPEAGLLRIETSLVRRSVPLARIGREDLVFEAGGLDRRLRIFRLPDHPARRAVVLRRRISLRPEGDNPLHVRVTTLDGHRAWSSPIYLFRRTGRG